MKIEHGNVALTSQEINDLRTSILESYKTRTGQILNPKTLNSNVSNYRDLYVNIDNIVSLRLLGVTSFKPFIGIFHSPKKNTDKSKTFRKKFINALYEYSHGCNRDEFFSSKINNNSIAVKQFKYIEGYWQCYYTKEARFSNLLETYRKANISVVALTVKGEDINRATVQFYQKDNWGKGSVEVQGSNMIFQLRSEKNNKPTFLVMNCGGNYIQDREGHIKYAKGICLYLNDAGYPKTSPCLMEHLDRDKFNKEFKDKYKHTEIDLVSSEFRDLFNNDKEIYLNSKDGNFYDKEGNFDDKAYERNERILSLFYREQLQLI